MVGDLKTQVRGGAPVFSMGQPSLLTWFKLESPRGNQSGEGLLTELGPHLASSFLQGGARPHICLLGAQ